MHLLDLSSNFCLSTGPSFNFCQHCASVGPLFNFHQISVRPWKIPSTSFTFPYIQWTFRQLPSNFHASLGLSGNFRQFLCICWTFRQLSVHPLDFPSTLVNFSCAQGNFCQLSVHPMDILPITVNLLYINGSFHQLLSFFCASERSSINSCEHSLHLKDLLSTSVKFRASAGHFVYFRQCFVHPLDLPSTFRANAGPSLYFYQLSVRPQNLLSTFCTAEGPSINHPLTFRAFVDPAVNFRHISLRPLDLP